MGITDFSRTLLLRVIAEHKPKSVIELGAQNLYINGPNYGKYADVFYNGGYDIKYECIDLNGENGAYAIDLSEDVRGVLRPHHEEDLVTDFGTSEHVQGFYQCWLNKWNLCKVGGVIINENPMTGNWPGHGLNYVTEEFYHELCAFLTLDPDQFRIGRHAAMGNTTDGWNVWCIMVKNRTEFISEEEFNALPWFKK